MITQVVTAATTNIVVAVSAVMTATHLRHCHVVRSLRHADAVCELG